MKKVVLLQQKCNHYSLSVRKKPILYQLQFYWYPMVSELTGIDLRLAADSPI